MQLVELKQLSTTTKGQCLRLRGGKISLLEFTPEECNIRVEYSGNNYTGFILVQTGFFLAYSYENLELFDIHFSKSLKRIKAVSSINGGSYDAKGDKALLMHVDSYSELNLSSFVLKQRAFPF